MAYQHISGAARLVQTFVSVPWGAFVAAFLFYVGLTVVAIGVQDLPDAPMIAAYLLPVAAYALVLLARAVRHAAAFSVSLGRSPVPALLR